MKELHYIVSVSQEDAGKLQVAIIENGGTFQGITLVEHKPFFRNAPKSLQKPTLSPQNFVREFAAKNQPLYGREVVKAAAKVGLKSKQVLNAVQQLVERKELKRIERGKYEVAK